VLERLHTPEKDRFSLPRKKRRKVFGGTTKSNEGMAPTNRQQSPFCLYSVCLPSPPLSTFCLYGCLISLSVFFVFFVFFLFFFIYRRFLVLSSFFGGGEGYWISFFPFGGQVVWSVGGVHRVRKRLVSFFFMQLDFRCCRKLKKQKSTND